jgi:hypothetical protein
LLAKSTSCCREREKGRREREEERVMGREHREERRFPMGHAVGQQMHRIFKCGPLNYFTLKMT